ncbi:MAG: CvpA family protein [Acutalibacteraceae bacterium]
MIWFDLAVIAVIVLFVITGAAKGAARTLLSLVALVVSFITALFLGNAVSQWAYTTFFRQSILSTVSSAIEENGLSDITATIADVIESFPQYVSSLFKCLGFDAQQVSGSVESAIEKAPQQGAEIIESVISPVIISLINIILVLVFFILMMIITGFLVKAISRVFNIPIIKQINTVAGGALGLVKGIIVVLFITMIFKASIPMMLNQTKQETDSQISQTYLFKYFYDTDLLKTEGFYGFKPY